MTRKENNKEKHMTRKSNKERRREAHDKGRDNTQHQYMAQCIVKPANLRFLHFHTLKK